MKKSKTLVGTTIEWTKNETLIRKGNKVLIITKPKQVKK